MDGQQAKYDDIFLGILQNEGQITPFLDVVFGFLYRRTDFYRILKEKNSKLGFPQGVAEKLVLQAFTKYKKLAIEDEKNEVALKNVKLEEKIKSVGAGIEKEKSQLTETQVEVEGSGNELKKKKDVSSESYNGAVRDKYSWSQTCADLDVYIKVPAHIIKAKMVRVNLASTHIKLEMKAASDWESLLEGLLLHKINMEETTWTLVPGEHIHINFEKVEECWWDAFLADEPKIDTSKLDCTKLMADLPDEDRSKIDELVFNENQKRMNKPTTEQMKVEGILKEAWDKEGSPFKGQPFDPSLVNISGSTDGLLGIHPSSS